MTKCTINMVDGFTAEVQSNEPGLVAHSPAIMYNRFEKDTNTK